MSEPALAFMHVTSFIVGVLSGPLQTSAALRPAVGWCWDQIMERVVVDTTSTEPTPPPTLESSSLLNRHSRYHAHHGKY